MGGRRCRVLGSLRAIRRSAAPSTAPHRVRNLGRGRIGWVDDSAPADGSLLNSSDSQRRALIIKPGTTIKREKVAGGGEDDRVQDAVGDHSEGRIRDAKADKVPLGKPRVKSAMKCHKPKRSAVMATAVVTGNLETQRWRKCG